MLLTLRLKNTPAMTPATPTPAVTRPGVHSPEPLLGSSGFVQEPARGSHRKFRHPKRVTVVLSGHGEGVDALPYQERQIRRMIEDSRR
jgi:predicted RNA binding protein YcfA (HicA-like mRNA interferase family)